jgi:hypothetical protein
VTSATDRDVTARLAETSEPSVDGGGRRGPLHRSTTPSTIDADEAAARDLRQQIASGGLEPLTPDPIVTPHLSADEVVFAQRPRAVLNAERDVPGYMGAIYITSKRILHLGQVVVSVYLRDIAESALAGERLLLTLRNGDGVTIDLPAPRLFRAQLAAAASGWR